MTFSLLFQGEKTEGGEKNWFISIQARKYLK